MTTDPSFRLTVEDVFSISSIGTCVSVKIETGALHVGGEVVIQGRDGEKKIVVDGITRFKKLLSQANAGDAVEILLKNITTQDVQPGDVILSPGLKIYGKAESIPRMTEDSNTNSISARLIEEAVNGNLNMVKKFILEGADINEIIKGESALTAAATGGHKEIVEYILNIGATPADINTALFSAAAKGHTDIAQMLLINGADINANSEGLTPIAAASFSGYADTVSLLLENRADLSISYRGRTPLMSAASRGHIDVVKVLLQHGADINITDDNGDSALTLASKHGRKDIIKLLEKKILKNQKPSGVLC